MTGGEYHRTSESPSVVSLNANNLIFFYNNGIHSGLEVNFASTLQNGISHVFNHPRQFVCSDVRVCIYKD